MAKYNYKDVSNALFINDKYERGYIDYNLIDDESKEVNFFIINRKMALKYIKQAKFLNHIDTDRALGMDLWHSFLKKNYRITPNWWYAKSNSGKKSAKSKFTNSDKERLMKAENISEEDFIFLETYYKDDLDYELKKIKRF